MDLCFYLPFATRAQTQKEKKNMHDDCFQSELSQLEEIVEVERGQRLKKKKIIERILRLKSTLFILPLNDVVLYVTHRCIGYKSLCYKLLQSVMGWVGLRVMLKIQVVINPPVYCCNYDNLSMKLVNFSTYKFCHVN